MISPFKHQKTGSGWRLPRLTLVKKIVVGYSAMAFFTIAALAFSTKGLVSLHQTAREIARTDLVFVNNVQRMRESLVAQERYVGKFLILESDDFRKLFIARELEFRTILEKMRIGKNIPELAPLTAIYAQYHDAADAAFKRKNSDSRAIQAAGVKVLASIDAIFLNEQKRLNTKLEGADQREQSTVRLTLILSFTGFLLASGVAVYITYSISTAVRKLKKATHRIAEGEFDYDPQIPAGDEIGDLARDFIHMAERLKELEQISLDASPLTRLPGNIAIERALNLRMAGGEHFAVCYADLDNFKAYNDRYGYIQGSELIRATGEIIYDETLRCGGDGQFIGHVGGDDFVMVLAADRFEEVCRAVLDRFDREIVAHYSPEDLAHGYLEGVDRYGIHRSFPIMTLSIAVLVCQQGEYNSAVDIARTAAEIKDHVKGQPGSNYFINRRKGTR